MAPAFVSVFFFLPWPLRSRPSSWFASDDFSSTWAEGVRFSLVAADKRYHSDEWERLWRSALGKRSEGFSSGSRYRSCELALSPAVFPNCNLTVELNTNNTDNTQLAWHVDSAGCNVLPLSWSRGERSHSPRTCALPSYPTCD